jgi:hypothetical protein
VALVALGTYLSHRVVERAQAANAPARVVEGAPTT